jgi:hypothetical protein
MILDAITNLPDQPAAILAAQSPTAHGRRDPAPQPQRGQLLPGNSRPARDVLTGAQIRMIWMLRSTHSG